MLPLTQEHVDRTFRIARWYGRQTRRAELSDLESAALEGLAKAARDWNADRALRRKRPTTRTHSFWSFACTKILGEMRDELRRLDHLTRDQRALVTEAPTGELAIEDESLNWINPQEPLPLDATAATEDGEDTGPIVELIEEPRNPIPRAPSFRLCEAGDRRVLEPGAGRGLRRHRRTCVTAPRCCARTDA